MTCERCGESGRVYAIEVDEDDVVTLECEACEHVSFASRESIRHKNVRVWVRVTVVDQERVH